MPPIFPVFIVFIDKTYGSDNYEMTNVFDMFCPLIDKHIILLNKHRFLKGSET